MAGNILPPVSRIRLVDLIASEGLPSDSYKISVTNLAQSLAHYSAAIIQLSASDGALIRSGLDSARHFFHQRDSYACAEVVHCNDSCEWFRTSGYYADPQLWQEAYDYRPGLTLTEPNETMEFPPVGLPDIFSVLGKAARDILNAISFSLNLRSFSFTEILDNVPLRNRDISSSVLTAYCHSRPSFPGAQPQNLTTGDGQLVMFSDDEHQVDKSLLTLVKSDQPWLHIKDIHGRWVLMDVDLGPQELIVYPGLALYHATAGYVNPALRRTVAGNVQANIYGRCSLAFKLMPRSMTSITCTEMREAGYGVEAQFQLPISVDDLMQRSHPTEQTLSRQTFLNYSYSADQDVSLKTLVKRRKKSSNPKRLPPSKRLRLEAQRVLKERVQDIADKKHLKLRFCNLKECESHMHNSDSPCSSLRTEIGWPSGVPFVHPHDLPNKAKLGFLEAYEPGWTASQQDIELSFNEPEQASQHHTDRKLSVHDRLK